MTYRDFFEQIIAYFGSYGKGKSWIVADWVKNNVKQEYLQELFDKLVETVESKYKVPPDIYEIKKVYRELPRHRLKQLEEPKISDEEALEYIEKVKGHIASLAQKSKEE
jgi:hypothetical protein